MHSPCPDQRNDSSVHWGHRDLWLCKACFEDRFGSSAPTELSVTTLMQSVTSEATDSTAEVCVPMEEALEVKNEMLYFVQNKSHGSELVTVFILADLNPRSIVHNVDVTVKIKFKMYDTKGSSKSLFKLVGHPSHLQLLNYNNH